MIWVISTGEAFWQHNISRHPKHLLQHLTVIYSSFISTSLGTKYSRKRRTNCVCACVRARVCILWYTGVYHLHTKALRLG